MEGALAAANSQQNSPAALTAKSQALPILKTQHHPGGRHGQTMGRALRLDLASRR
jgi:hypothetical protein